MEKIVVLGIGNILMQDEGFGVRVVEELTRRYTFPDTVEVLDGGTLGMELLRFIKGADRLLIIDAINGGSEPGAFFSLPMRKSRLILNIKYPCTNWGFRTCWRRWKYWKSR